MHLTPEIVEIIEWKHIPWDTCSIYSNAFFEEKVARSVSAMEFYSHSRRYDKLVENVTLTKNGKVDIWVIEEGELKRRLWNKNHVFLTQNVPGTFEYDIFQGKQGITKVKKAMSAMKDLKGAMKSWCLERFVLHGAGYRHHQLFYVFDNEPDALLFAMTLQSRA